jgi:fucose 4-O-acetylase-like acetyltransferase
MTKRGLGENGDCNAFVHSARDSRIDAIKGGTILLVVLGHAIQSHVRGFDNNLLFRIIYPFTCRSS